MSANPRIDAEAPVLVRPKQRPTSILLPEELIAKLTKKGARKGMGYQTFLKMIVLDHIDDY